MVEWVGGSNREKRRRGLVEAVPSGGYSVYSCVQRRFNRIFVCLLYLSVSVPVAVLYMLWVDVGGDVWLLLPLSL